MKSKNLPGDEKGRRRGVGAVLYGIEATPRCQPGPKQKATSKTSDLPLSRDNF